MGKFSSTMSFGVRSAEKATEGLEQELKGPLVFLEGLGNGEK